MKRQDLSVVALALRPGADFSDLDLFCKERLDLELQTIRETDYYASLQKDYGPIRWLAWLVVLLVSGAGCICRTQHECMDPLSDAFPNSARYR